MLDLFLEALHEKNKQAEADTRQVDLMRRLPDEELLKIASGEESLLGKEAMYFGDEKWLDRFKGTPLFQEALEIEKQELEHKMQNKQQRQERDEAYKAEDTQRDELCIQRKLLDLKLAELEEGGGEEVAPEGDPAAEVGAPEEPVAEAAPEQVPDEASAQAPEAPVPAAPAVEEPKEASAALIYPAVLGGAGYMGHSAGKASARRGEEAPKWGVGKYLGSALVHPYGAYQIGKSIGHGAQTEKDYDRKMDAKSEAKAKKAMVLAVEKMKGASAGYTEDEIQMYKEAFGAGLVAGASRLGKAFMGAGRSASAAAGGGAKGMLAGGTAGTKAMGSSAGRMFRQAAPGAASTIQKGTHQATQWATKNPRKALAGGVGAGYVGGRVMSPNQQ